MCQLNQEIEREQLPLVNVPRKLEIEESVAAGRNQRPVFQQQTEGVVRK